MEAIIWQHDSIDGANHGSCAAFASLTLESVPTSPASRLGQRQFLLSMAPA
jgi:hypothetical protein